MEIQDEVLTDGILYLLKIGAVLNMGVFKGASHALWTDALSVVRPIVCSVVCGLWRYFYERPNLEVMTRRPRRSYGNISANCQGERLAGNQAI